MNHAARLYYDLEPYGHMGIAFCSVSLSGATLNPMDHSLGL